MVVSELVRGEVVKRFGDASPSVIAALAGTPLPFLDAPNRARERDRVHLAIIKLSAGDAARVVDILKLATRDWRDTLVAAGLANGDWPEVLRAEGFSVPE
jgi:hypothetical protein